MRLRKPKRPTGVYVIASNGVNLPVDVEYVGRVDGIDEWRVVLPGDFRGELVGGGCDVLPGRTGLNIPIGRST